MLQTRTVYPDTLGLLKDLMKQPLFILKMQNKPKIQSFLTNPLRGLKLKKD